jgi:hypothetical protein
MSFVSFGIVKAFFGINIIGFAGDCRGTQQIRMSRITVVVQMIGLNYISRIGDGNFSQELEFFLWYKVFP